jgi:hypothetical protein
MIDLLTHANKFAPTGQILETIHDNSEKQVGANLFAQNVQHRMIDLLTHTNKFAPTGQILETIHDNSEKQVGANLFAQRLAKTLVQSI